MRDRARDPDGQARRRARHRQAVRGRAGQLRAHAGPARLVAEAEAAELPDARARGGEAGARGRKIRDIFAGVDIDESHPTRSNVEGINQTERLRTSSTRARVTNLVETDMLWGHRNDPVNFHRCLQDFDRRLRPAGGPAGGRSPDLDVRPRLRPDDSVDRPLAGARPPARIRRGPKRGGTHPRG